MSREIKFRAWMGDYFKGPYDLKEIACNVEDIGDNILHNKEIIWEQFTGLKDRNGKEIFEGDIVRFETLDARGNEVLVGAVEFSFGCFKAMVPCNETAYEKRFFQGHSEVIGNIHENGDLLK